MLMSEVDQQERAVLAQIRSEQASVLQQMETKAGIARAEVASIPAALAQLQGLLAASDEAGVSEVECAARSR